MRILQLNPHLTTAELSSKLMSCVNPHHRSYWQILLSVSYNPSKKADEYALFLGVTKSKIYKVVEIYNKEGAGFLDNLKIAKLSDHQLIMMAQQAAQTLLPDLKKHPRLSARLDVALQQVHLE